MLNKYLIYTLIIITVKYLELTNLDITKTYDNLLLFLSVLFLK